MRHHAETSATTIEDLMLADLRLSQHTPRTTIRWDLVEIAASAVGEPRRKFSQVALPDWLTAQRTERLRAGCPAIHQDEFHMPPPHSVLAPGLVSRAGN